MNEYVNVMIADGRKLFREGLCLVLERQKGIRIVGEAEDVQDVPRLVKALCADIIILNLTQQLPQDVTAVRAILRAKPSLRVIVLSLCPAIEYIQQLMEAGVSGCLTKECASSELVAAVEKVGQGGVYLSPSLVDRVVHRYVRSTSPQASDRTLAPREQEVLRLIAAGQSTKEIAATLTVSSKTIETHRRRIMEKLNRHSVAELTKYAVAQGLVSLEPMA